MSSLTLSGISWTLEGEGDGKVLMIIPDASSSELQNFVRRLYSPGDDVFYTAAENTPVIVPGTPDVFHTAVPQTPLEPPLIKLNIEVPTS